MKTENGHKTNIWENIASPSDKTASAFYGSLIEAKAHPVSMPWIEARWVRVPANVVNAIAELDYNTGATRFWTGMRWVEARFYEDGNGYLWLRLPAANE